MEKNSGVPLFALTIFIVCRSTGVAGITWWSLNHLLFRFDERINIYRFYEIG